MTLTLTTQPVNAIQKLKATGNLTLDLGEAVVFVDDAVDWSTFFSPNSCDKYGFVYDTSTKAAPGDVAPGSSGYANYVEETADIGNGDFSKDITSLTAGQTYYARAYIHNADGYTYGDEITFQTVNIVIDEATFEAENTLFVFGAENTDFVMSFRRT